MVFWVGTCLQIIIPSAASLAVILMATLFPVLRAAGMSTLTAAALIATTATIVPTPLGGDNVVAARVLGFENVVDYVAFHLAPITIPALFVMGIVHYFWLKKRLLKPSVPRKIHRPGTLFSRSSRWF